MWRLHLRSDQRSLIVIHGALEASGPGAGEGKFQGLVLTELLMIGPGWIRVCAFVDVFDRRWRIHIDEDLAVKKIQFGLWTVK